MLDNIAKSAMQIIFKAIKIADDTFRQSSGCQYLLRTAVRCDNYRSKIKSGFEVALSTISAANQRYWLRIGNNVYIFAGIVHDLMVRPQIALKLHLCYRVYVPD